MDIHPFVKGTVLETVWRRKVESELVNTKVNFASPDDLIEMKRAAGRVKDREDLEYMLKIKEKTKN